MSVGRASGVLGRRRGGRRWVDREPGVPNGAECLVKVEVTNGVHVSLCCALDLLGVRLAWCDARPASSAGFDETLRFEDRVGLRDSAGCDAQVCCELTDGGQSLSAG